jgi:glycosyltransferase involved in cell wall biosynthesis
MPVYNNAATLRRAIDSVLRQTHGECLIHVSDDTSTDASWEIAKDLAASHANFTCIRQAQNLGPTGNFRFLLQQAQTPYFMWLAGDDYLEPTYVERMLAELESDPGLVTCVSQVRFVRPDGSSRLASGTYPLQADIVTNLAAYLSDPTDNARQYGLHRTRPLQMAFPTGDFLIGYDWALMAGSLLYGRHAEVAEILMVRNETPHQAYMAMIRRNARWWLERVLPLLPMSLDLLFRQRIPLGLPVLKALLYINIVMHFSYAREFHPRYAKLEPFLHRHLLWRLAHRPMGNGSAHNPGCRGSDGAGRTEMP